MRELNFPKISYRLENSENNIKIFDVIRKKFVVLQPEEWVRQHCLHYLIHYKSYPKSLINVEKELKVNGLKKRYDIVVYRPNGSVFLIVECKAPQIEITQNTFDQIARYNLTLNAEFPMPPPCPISTESDLGECLHQRSCGLFNINSILNTIGDG